MFPMILDIAHLVFNFLQDDKKQVQLI